MLRLERVSLPLSHCFDWDPWLRESRANTRCLINRNPFPEVQLVRRIVIPTGGYSADTLSLARLGLVRNLTEHIQLHGTAITEYFLSSCPCNLLGVYLYATSSVRPIPIVDMRRTG